MNSPQVGNPCTIGAWCAYNLLHSLSCSRLSSFFCLAMLSAAWVAVTAPDLRVGRQRHVAQTLPQLPRLAPAALPRNTTKSPHGGHTCATHDVTRATHDITRATHVIHATHDVTHATHGVICDVMRAERVVWVVWLGSRVIRGSWSEVCQSVGLLSWPDRDDWPRAWLL